MVTYRCSRCKEETKEIVCIQINKTTYGSMVQEKFEVDFCPVCASELYKRIIKDLKAEENL